MGKDALLGYSSGNGTRNLVILHKKGNRKATFKVIAEKGYVRIIMNNYFIRKRAHITLGTSCIFLAIGIFNSHCSCLVDVKTILSHKRSGLMNLMILLKKMKVFTVIKITKLKRTRGNFCVRWGLCKEKTRGRTQSFELLCALVALQTF